MIPLRNLVEQRSRETFDRYWGNVFWPTLTSEEDVPETIVDLVRSEPAGFAQRAFRAQAWYLAFFLNEYEQGKYRKAYQDILMTALRGRHRPPAYGSGRFESSHAAFAGILGLKSDADWERVEQEYKAYVNTALSR
jgi:hypothetical protein